jgi:hypothetical protein
MTFKGRNYEVLRSTQAKIPCWHLHSGSDGTILLKRMKKLTIEFIWFGTIIFLDGDKE